MVRSKSEENKELLFHLVEQIRADTKYFAVSLDELERDLESAGYYDRSDAYECDDDGARVVIPLRLNISAATGHPRSWSIAIKLHGTRIDGIDHHEWLPGADGKREEGGWHRHHWNPRTKTASCTRVKLVGFDRGMKTLRDFLRRAFKELGVEVNLHDDGSQSLRFD